MIGLEIKKIINHKHMKAIIFIMIAFCLLYFYFRCTTDLVGEKYTGWQYQRMYDELERDNSLRSDELDNMIYQINQKNEYHTGTFEGDKALLGQILTEVQQQENYKTMIGKVVAECESIVAMTILSDASFSKKNAKKTLHDFAEYEAVEIQQGKVYGAKVLFELGIDDFVVMALILLLIIVVTDEFETNSISLQKCAYLDCRKIALYKLLALYFSVILLWLIIFIFKFIVVSTNFGTDFLKLPVQSFEKFSTSTLYINGLQAVVIYWLFKTLIFLTVASVMFFVASWVKKYQRMIVAFFMFVISEYIVFLQINENGFLSFLKNYNLFSFLDIGKILFVYKNINFFGEPVSYVFCTIAIIVVLLLVSVTLSILGYGSINYNGIISRNNKNIKTQKFCFGNLVLAESRKSVYWGVGLIIIIVLTILISVFRFDVSEKSNSLEDIYYKSYIEKTEGEFDDNKLQYLYSERERIEEIEIRLLIEADKLSFIEKQILNAEIDKKAGLLKAIEYAEYIKNNPSRYFVYEHGYNVIFGKDEGRLAVLTYHLITAIAFCLIVWWQYIYEDRNRMKQLLRISKSGINKIEKAKMINVLFASIVLMIGIWLPWFLQVSNQYGLHIWNAPASSLRDYESLPDMITIRILVFGTYVVYWLFLLMIGILGRFLDKCQIPGESKLVILLLICVGGPVLVLI